MIHEEGMHSNMFVVPHVCYSVLKRKLFVCSQKKSCLLPFRSITTDW